MLRVTRTALRGRSRSAVLAALDAVVPSHRREERESTYLSSSRSVSTTAAAATAVVASSTLLANTESLSALLGVGGAGSVFPGLAGSSALALSAANAGPWVGGASLTFLTWAPVIACQAFWAAPWPTMKEVEKNGTTGGLPPLGYFSMLANGYLWMAYGYSADMNMTIIIPNFTGMLAGGYYTMKYIKHSSGEFNLMPYYAGTAASFATVTYFATMMPVEQGQNAIGYLGCAVVASMLGGPLQTIKTVLKEKSTRTLPFPMAVMTLINASLWFSFGLAVIHDPFVWGPNVIGIASGATQLAMFAKFGMYKEGDVIEGEVLEDVSATAEDDAEASVKEEVMGEKKSE